jgi:hypothetical protein
MLGSVWSAFTVIVLSTVTPLARGPWFRHPLIRVMTFFAFSRTSGFRCSTLRRSRSPKTVGKIMNTKEFSPDTLRYSMGSNAARREFVSGTRMIILAYCVQDAEKLFKWFRTVLNFHRIF